MKSLQETLSYPQIQEGVFDTKADSLDTTIIKDWVETWICGNGTVLVNPGEATPDSKYTVEIHNNNKVYIDSLYDSLLFISTMGANRPKVFNGFPVGIQFFNMKTGKPFDFISIVGNIASIKNIPIDKSGNSTVSIMCNNSIALSQEVIDELAKYKKYKKLTISSAEKAGQSNVDFTKLSGYIKSLEIPSLFQDLEFDKSLKVDTLAFGYEIKHCHLINLPEVKKTISFRLKLDDVKNNISGCKGNDAINWDKVEIKGPSLSTIDKTTIKNILTQGADGTADSPVIDPNTIKTIYAELEKFMTKSPNGDTDPTKDAFGVDLHSGDIIMYSGSQGALLDVYIEAIGSRIKTASQRGVKPHQIINLNNPELFKLVRKYSEK